MQLPAPLDVDDLGADAASLADGAIVTRVQQADQNATTLSVVAYKNI